MPDISLPHAHPRNIVQIRCMVREKDGGEVTRKIRVRTGLKYLTVIATASNGIKQDIEKVLETGRNGPVAMPANPDKMYATMAKWLGADSRHEPVFRQPA